MKKKIGINHGFHPNNFCYMPPRGTERTRTIKSNKKNKFDLNQFLPLHQAHNARTENQIYYDYSITCQQFINLDRTFIDCYRLTIIDLIICTTHCTRTYEDLVHNHDITKVQASKNPPSKNDYNTFKLLNTTKNKFLENNLYPQFLICNRQRYALSLSGSMLHSNYSLTNNLSSNLSNAVVPQHHRSISVHTNFDFICKYIERLYSSCTIVTGFPNIDFI